MHKKKKKKNQIGLLDSIDKNLDKKYQDAMEELQGYRWELMKADKKAKKIARKKVKSNPKFYDYEKVRRDTRMKIVQEMEGNNFIARFMDLLRNLEPVVILISRLVASIILAILAIPSVKMRIKPETVTMLTSLYNHAMAISGTT